MPSEDISALDSQGLANPFDTWAANHRTTPADYALIDKYASKMNPTAGENAPKYFKPIDPKAWADQTFSNPYSPENIAKQQYQDSHPMSMADYITSQKGLPNTVYGNQAGRFVPTNDSGGRGGQWVGGFVQLGGSKSQGPQFDQLGSNVKYDKSKAVWDNNYGWIMPKPTPKAEQGDWVTGALMTAASLAAGAVGIPPMAMAAINAAKGYGSGESLGKIAMNMAPSLIGAGLNTGGFNMPPELSSLMKYLNYAKQGYGIYNSVKQHNPMGLIPLGFQNFAGAVGSAPYRG